MGDVVRFLKQTKIEDLFKDDKTELVFAKTTDPALQTLHQLLKAKVLSIPLYDEKKKQYTAFFDIIDVLHFVTSVRRPPPSAPGPAEPNVPRRKELVSVSFVFRCCC